MMDMAKLIFKPNHTDHNLLTTLYRQSMVFNTFITAVKSVDFKSTFTFLNSGKATLSNVKFLFNLAKENICALSIVSCLNHAQLIKKKICKRKHLLKEKKEKQRNYSW